MTSSFCGTFSTLPLPLYCFCGNVPLLAQLRDAKRDASSGTVEALRKITFAIRERFGRRVRIIVRADSGFAREEIMAWCEANAVYYCLGLARNKRLGARLGKSFGELYEGIKTAEIQVPCRRFEDFEYRTRKSWSRARRVVGKAEILDKGQNPRFVVTNLPAEGFAGEPEERFAAPALYEKLYCARGEMENRIKEAQQDLFADRTSTGWMASNQLRLWFSAFAHLMLSVLRAEVLRGTDLASGYHRPDPAQAFQDWCPHQDQLPTHSSGVSQRLPLPGNFPARLCKPLRNAGGLKFKELLSTQESELASAKRGTLLTNSYRRGKKPKSPALRYQPGRIRPDKPKVRILHPITIPENLRSFPNEIECEQCGVYTFNARGYDLATGGFTMGIDYRIGSHFAIGLTGGHAYTGADIFNGSSIQVNGGKLGLYATAFGSGFYLDTGVIGGLVGYARRSRARPAEIQWEATSTCSSQEATTGKKAA